MKGIIFDIGNVIQPTSWKQSGDIFSVSGEQYKGAFLDDREHYWNHYESGNMETAIFGKHVLGNLGVESNYNNQQLFSESLGYLWDSPSLEMLSIVKSIDPKIKKGILSNSCFELEQKISNSDDKYFNLFEPHVYLSHNIHAKKPDEIAYKTVVEGMGLEYGECIFIDDKEANINAANALGIHGFLFPKNSQSKYQELRQFLSPYLK